MTTATDAANEATRAARSFRSGELVPARNAALLIAAYDAMGFDADAALARLGLARDRIEAPGALVPAATSYGLLAIACERDPTFPVRAGAAVPWGDAGLIDYVNGSRATLGAVLDSLVRFVRVVSTNSRYELVEERAGVFLRATYQPLPPPDLARMLTEFTLSLLFGRLRDITGERVGSAVRFAHAAPEWERALRERFGEPLVFRARASGILFTRASLALPSRRADKRLEAIVERHALEVLAADPKSESLSDSVAAAIRAALPGGLPTMKRIARSLAMSERTLRRRLADQGLVFERLRDNELERLARELLASRRASVEEVAYLLGFSEASAFQRAFKRWTGETPGSFRAKRA